MFAGLAQLVARNLAKVGGRGFSPLHDFRPDSLGLFIWRDGHGKQSSQSLYPLGLNPSACILTNPSSAGFLVVQARLPVVPARLWIACLKSANGRTDEFESAKNPVFEVPIL